MTLAIFIFNRISENKKRKNRSGIKNLLRNKKKHYNIDTFVIRYARNLKLLFKISTQVCEVNVTLENIFTYYKNIVLSK